MPQATCAGSSQVGLSSAEEATMRRQAIVTRQIAMAKERRSRKGASVACQNPGPAGRVISASVPVCGLGFFLDMRRHFLPSRLPGAR
jgi:hypothetical protein